MNTYGSGIPNWRDRKAYPKRFEDIYERNWRWEFLRRCPEYKQAWSRGVPDDDLSHNAPPEVYRKPAPEDSELCRKVFRIRHLVNPRGEQKIPNAPGTMFNALTGAITINPPNPDITRGPDFVMVGFDLNLPLKPQIDEVHQQLKFQQKTLKEKLVTFKKHRDKWPKYIRVIDAIDQGATPTEIYHCFTEESAGDDEEKMNDFYGKNCQPDATAMGWHSRALDVMESVIRLR